MNTKEKARSIEPNVRGGKAKPISLERWSFFLQQKS
jgi:hypothetical protein